MEQQMDAHQELETIAALLPDVTAIRRDIHAHPELAYEEHRTAGIVEQVLRGLGFEVATGIGGTGVVGTLRRGTSRRSVGLRADMDALGFQEETGLPHRSTVDGKFHGCGHDGHTAMLLGAARHIAASVEFDGVVHFIFQPAEEGLGGAKAMIDDGLFERFACDEVYAVHNWPDLPAGHFQTRSGPIMAAADRFEIVITGKGGHAALPHQTPDAILAAADLVLQLNTIVARRVPASETAVLSVTMVQAGSAHNVIPAEVRVIGTVRSFEPAVQDRIEVSLRAMVAGTARSHEVDVAVVYDRYYPATVNAPSCADRALAAAALIPGVNSSPAPVPAFTSEDFSFMLEAKPGAYCWLGQGAGEGSPALHNPHYDFNDAVSGTGIAWFANIVRLSLGAPLEEGGAKEMGAQ
ncbi:M20 aminoacylase family protein [Novosphingobium aerophilum]|uniref:M20 aminoacylase family protein n=1 Tax=Novosphingobium aerophilum TaxID=2839843 RepID=UPI003FD66D16